MLRRMRVQLLPPKKYSHRGFFPTNHNDLRYFKLRFLPGRTNSLNKIKWFHSKIPITSLKNVLQGTTKTSVHMISPVQFKMGGRNHDTYFNHNIPSTPNYCSNTYKHDGLSTHATPICIEKLPFFPTPLVRMSGTSLKSTSTTMLFESKTNSPYTKHFLPTNSFLNSINTSKIYFTIGDAITPETPSTTKLKINKISELKNYVTYLSGDNNIKPKSSSVVSESLTMTSSPFHLQKESLVNQKPNKTPTYHLQENEAKNNTEDLYVNLNATKSYIVTELTTSNTCENFPSNVKKNCVEIEDNSKEHTEVVSVKETAVPPTLKSLPLIISTDIFTALTPLNTVSYENMQTTVKTIGKSPTLSKTELPANTILNRPVYRRKKIVEINKRLVFKEKLKGYDGSSIPPTLTTSLRSYDSNSSYIQKRKYISATFPTLAQSIQSTRGTEYEPPILTNSTPKTDTHTKTKFQIKSRSRWTPKYDKTYRKSKVNVTTSTKITVTPNPSKEVQTERSSKTNKLRSKINRRAKNLKINTTENISRLHLHSITSSTSAPMTSSTPESAIMRITNMNNGKITITKNLSSNSLIGMGGNGFVAELPIVTYFKEVRVPTYVK